MNEPIHEEKLHGCVIKIYQDEDATSPEEYGDDALFLVGYHRDFSVEGPRPSRPKELWRVDPNGYKSRCGECGQGNYTATAETGKKCGRCGKESRRDVVTYDEKSKRGALVVEKADAIALVSGRAATKENGEEYPAELAKKYHVFPLEAYIHSGVRLSLVADCAPFPDRRWDVSLLGAVFVSKKEWRTRKAAEKAARGLVSSWNDYLSGNVYGYDIEGLPADEMGSCWGFSGDYDAPGGALHEARALVESLTKKGTTEPNGQRLFEFAKA